MYIPWKYNGILPENIYFGEKGEIKTGPINLFKFVA